MFNLNRDEPDDRGAETTFSVEDWEGSHPTPVDPLRVVLAATDDAASAAAVMVTGWMAQRHHLHPIAVHVLDIERPAPDYDLARDLAGTVRTLGGLPTRWPLDIETGRRSDTILQCVQAFKADLVILGRHRARISAAGRLASEEELNIPQLVMEAERVPVLAVHPDCLELPKRIVVAIDFHRASLSAARTACKIADTGSTIYLVHVWPGQSSSDAQSADERARAARGVSAALNKLQRFLSRRKDITVKTSVLLGDPVVELHSFVRHIHPDLMALGTHGRNPKHPDSLGSVTHALIDDPSVSSILVAPPAQKVIHV